MTPEQIHLRQDHPDQFARELLERLLNQEREQKIETYPDDLPNRLVYISDHENVVNMILPVSVGQGLLPAKEIGLSCEIGRQQFGAPFLIAFIAEAYMQIIDEKDKDVPTKRLPRKRGVITDRYNRGDPSVTEALTIFLVHRKRDKTLRTIAVQLPFHGEGGEVVFGEVTYIDSNESGNMGTGAVPEALAAAFGSEQN